MSIKREFAKDAAQLVLSVLALSWSPTAIATAVVPAASLLHIGREVWGKAPKEPAERAIEQMLSALSQHDATEDQILRAQQALAQMPKASSMSRDDLTGAATHAKGLNARVVDLLMTRLPATDPEARHLVERALGAGVAAMTQDRAFWEPLSFELILRLTQDMAQVRDDTTVTREMVAQLRAGLDGVQRPELNTLAHRFGHPDPENAGLTDLKGFLLQKAEDLRRYQAQIAAIDDRVAGLGNLKAAAKDAADRLDFAEVEALLARVDEVETEIAAQTKELRADNALLQGKVDAAYAHLSAAADSFQGLDPVEPARRRVDYFNRLYNHGLRYGGAGLGLAAQMLQTALADLSETAQPLLWAAAQNRLGNALGAQGSRSAGPEGAALLAEAVTAYRAAQRVYTEDAHSLDWAATQNNLGTARQAQGKHGSGLEWAGLLAEAVTAYRAALRVRTEDAEPERWAMTQNNLGAALSDQGERSAGPEGAALLAEAVTAHRAALRVYTEEAYPLDWAGTQNNLGTVLGAQGGRSAGLTGASLLAEAVTAFRAALRVYTEDSVPLNRAVTQLNIAIVEASLAQHDTCTDPRPHLQAALGAVEDSLRVFDPVHTSQNHETASKLRDSILAALAELDGGA